MIKNESEYPQQNKIHGLAEYVSYYCHLTSLTHVAKNGKNE